MEGALVDVGIMLNVFIPFHLSTIWCSGLINDLGYTSIELRCATNYRVT
jgi:hypothetical protein